MIVGSARARKVGGAVTFLAVFVDVSFSCSILYIL